MSSNPTMGKFVREVPSIGRIVHVYFYDKNEKPVFRGCCAAIVTRVDKEMRPEVQLFPPVTLSASLLIAQNRTMPLEYSEELVNATWHWPRECKCGIE